MTTKFADRVHAGRTLAERLVEYGNRSDVLVLGLPRGGVPVAAEVARALNAELDVVVVRKVGVPSHPELAMGALAAVGGAVETVQNEDVIAQMRERGLDGDAFDKVAAQERVELARREQTYRAGRAPAAVSGRVVVLVDDGLATGATMRAAAAAVRRQGPAHLVVAAPAGQREVCDRLREVADAVVCATTPEPFRSVGHTYEDFTPTTDDQVRQVLAAGSGEDRSD